MILERSKKFIKGFTLVELSVVVAIIALLAAIVAPMASIQIRNKKIKATQQEMKNLKTALLMYYSDVYETNVGHQFPDTGYLEYLENNPFGMADERHDRWDGSYMKRVFGDYTEDGWNTNYAYNYAVAGSSFCTIKSYGPDGQTGTAATEQDDLTLTVSGEMVLREKIMRVRDELEVIKKTAQEHFFYEGTYPADIYALFISSYLGDVSYRSDEWGSDYEKDPGANRFISAGPDLDSGTSDDNILPY